MQQIENVNETQLLLCFTRFIQLLITFLILKYNKIFGGKTTLTYQVGKLSVRSYELHLTYVTVPSPEVT